MVDVTQADREAAAMAAFGALAGNDVDPFSMPETWDHAQVIADAVIASLSTRHRTEAVKPLVEALEQARELLGYWPEAPDEISADLATSAENVERMLSAALREVKP